MKIGRLGRTRFVVDNHFGESKSGMDANRQLRIIQARGECIEMRLEVLYAL